ncbi:MAG: hypothetical protein M3Z25_08765 [Actinomycetota bacterium]|nr:hypothetical protein [Actinomycetota bacterium]
MNGCDEVLGAGFRLEVLAGCNGGPCPKVGARPGRPGQLIVQGLRVPDDQRSGLGVIPDHEDVVEIPEEILLAYARRMLAEGRI